MSFQYAGATNPFVPQYDTQAKLIINYSRDPKKAKINELMTVRTVDKPIGKYLRIKPEVQGNITATWNQSRRWPDGAPRPLQLEAGQKFDFVEFFTERFIEDYPIGYLTEEAAVWDIVKTQSNVLANRMMRGRAKEFYTVLQDSSNYDSANTATATAAGGGLWSNATSTARYIQKSLRYGVEKILQSTMNGVTPEDLVLVLSPTVAGKMAESAEIADYMAGSPFSKSYLEGTGFKYQLGNFGLPPELYGIKIVVDPLVVDSAALGATSSKSFLAGSTTAYLIARPGSVNGDAGGSSFGFIDCFVLKGWEMFTEVVDDYINKRKILNVIDHRQIKAVAPEAAFLFTSVV
jgi:hypothetical protein